MLNDLITYLNTLITAQGDFQKVRGLCEVVTPKGSTAAFPAEWSKEKNGYERATDFDKWDGSTYWRLTGPIGTNQVDSPVRALSDIERTYPLRLVCSMKRSLIPNAQNTAYAHDKLAWAVQKVFKDKEQNIKTELGARYVSLAWGAVNHDHSVIQSTELANVERVVGSGWVLITMDLAITVRMSRECIADFQDEVTAPTSLTATSGAASIALAWTSALIEFWIYRSTDGIEWRKIGESATTTYSDTSAQEGSAYFYRVKARSGGVLSSWSNIAGAQRFSSSLDIDFTVVIDATDPTLATFTATGDSAENYIWTDNFGTVLSTSSSFTANIKHYQAWNITLQAFNSAGQVGEITKADVNSFQGNEPLFYYLEGGAQDLRAFFHLVKVHPDQTNCLTMKRDSDGAEQDFGFIDRGDGVEVVDIAAIDLWEPDTEARHVIRLYTVDSTFNMIENTLSNAFGIYPNGQNGIPYLQLRNLVQSPSYLFEYDTINGFQPTNSSEIVVVGWLHHENYSSQPYGYIRLWTTQTNQGVHQWVGNSLYYGSGVGLDKYNCYLNNTHYEGWNDTVASRFKSPLFDNFTCEATQILDQNRGTSEHFSNAAYDKLTQTLGVVGYNNNLIDGLFEDMRDTERLYGSFVRVHYALTDDELRVLNKWNEAVFGVDTGMARGYPYQTVGDSYEDMPCFFSGDGLLYDLSQTIAVNNGNPFSLSCYFKIMTEEVGQFPILANSGSNVPRVEIDITNGRVNVELVSTSQFNFGTIDPWTWYHLTVTISSDTFGVINCFLNGTPSADNGSTNGNSVQNFLTLFRRSGGYYGNMRIAHLAVWDRELNVTETTNLAAATRTDPSLDFASIAADPIHYWKFNDGYPSATVEDFGSRLDSLTLDTEYTAGGNLSNILWRKGL